MPVLEPQLPQSGAIKSQETLEKHSGLHSRESTDFRELESFLMGNQPA